MKPPMPIWDGLVKEIREYMKWYLDSSFWHNVIFVVVTLILVTIVLGAVRGMFIDMTK